MPSITTTDTQRLLRAVLESPGDDTLRLVYADALDEDGRHDEAELIRLQIAKETDGDKWHGFLCLPEKKCKNCVQERRLLSSKERAIGPDVRAFLDSLPPLHGPAADCRRGMVESVRCPLQTWIDHGPTLCTTAPILFVEVSDRRPHAREYGGGDGRYCWYFSKENYRHYVPLNLCKVMTGSDDLWTFAEYDTIEAARLALSMTCVNWARSMVEPPLPPLS